jgi:hypothetical protein
MKPGQIRPLYLEPRLHKQSVKQEINFKETNGNKIAYITHSEYTLTNQTPNQVIRRILFLLHFPTTFILNFGLHRVFEIRRGQIFGRSDRSLILDSPNCFLGN